MLKSIKKAWETKINYTSKSHWGMIGYEWCKISMNCDQHEHLETNSVLKFLKQNKMKEFAKECISTTSENRSNIWHQWRKKWKWKPGLRNRIDSKKKSLRVAFEDEHNIMLYLKN